MVALLEKRNLIPPTRVARVRMFHLPGADRRSELMIIYGEALPPDSHLPASAEGVDLDTQSPADATMLLDHARQGLTLRKH